MESIIRLNHRNRTQLKDIVNYINTIIGARVINTYNSETRASSAPTERDFCSKDCGKRENTSRGTEVKR